MDGYRTKTNDVKNKLYILVSAGMVLPAAFLFYVVSDLPHIFIVACLGFTISYFIRKPLQYTDRSIIYSVVIALVLVVFLDLIFPMKQDRFFHIGKIFRSNITVPLAIYLAVFATFYESSNYSLGFNAAFSLIVILLGGDYRITGPSINHTGLFGFLLSNKNFNTFFLSVGCTNIIMILIAFHLARKSLFHKSHLGMEWKKITVTISAIMLSILIALIMLFTYHTYKKEIMRLEQYFRSLTYKGNNYAKIMFDREIDLQTTIRANRNKNRREIMLRVSGSKNPPGYLRGRVYQFYSHGKWSETTDLPKNTNFKLNVKGLAIHSFFLEKNPGDEGEALNIYPSNSCCAEFLFLPGNTKKISIVADRVDYTNNGLFIPKSWEKDGGYTAIIPNTDPFSAFQKPENFIQINYLLVPPEFSKDTKNILEEIYGRKTNNFESTSNNPQLSDSEIIEKMVTFFHTKFQYNLQPEFSADGEDPVAHFLNTTREGHCELFASATAMLLRQKGIPSRYVTGFICHEEHPNGNYFVSRLRDAHAWVEAYLRDEKKWVVVEPTPPSPNPQESKWGFFELWTDRIKQVCQQMFADIRRGYVARAVLAALLAFVTILWEFMTHPFGGILFIITILLLFFWRYSLHKKRKYQLKFNLDVKISKIQKKMRKLEKIIEKRTNTPRNSDVTFEEWIDKIDKSNTMSSNNLNQLVELLHLYQQLRFSTETISKKQIDTLEALATQLT